MLDKDPDTILQYMRPYWKRHDSNIMKLKLLGCFNTETGLILYVMHNECNKQEVVSELSNILELARNEEREKDKEFLFTNKDIPLTTSRILMSNMPWQDTLMYDDLHWRDSNRRKVIHIECAEVKTSIICIHWL